MKRKLLGLCLAICMALNLITFITVPTVSAALPTSSEVPNYSRELKTLGNKVVYADTEEPIVLRGVNIPSLGWGMAEHLAESIVEMYDGWNSNLIRLAVNPNFWFNGSVDAGKNLTKEKYRQWIDDMVKAAQVRGKYIIIDCHTYVCPVQETMDFWMDMCDVYGNNPAVLFGLLNEPHSIDWELWRNGGTKNDAPAIGHQALVEAIRDKGIKNILIAAGLNWGYNLSGIVDGYALIDQGSGDDLSKAGNGIIYDSHVYPGKSGKNRDGWNSNLGPVREKYPVLVGEWGWDSSDSNITNGTNSTDAIYNLQFLKWMDDGYGEYTDSGSVPINWTAWNLHMKSTPRMITDWNFMPTDFNGKYVKEALLNYPSTNYIQEDKTYTADFSKDVFRGISGATVENEALSVTSGSKMNVKLNLSTDWNLNGVQTLEMDINASDAQSLEIGFYGTDMETWTKKVSLNAGDQHITIGIDELVRQGNPKTDGKLTPAITAITLLPAENNNGSLTVDNVKINTAKNPTLTAKEYPYIPPEGEGDYTYDFDTDATKVTKFGSNAGFTASYAEDIPGVDGQPTTTVKANYASNAGFATLYLPRTHKSKYFSFCIKNPSGVANSPRFKLESSEGAQNFTPVLKEGDTGWKQFIFEMDGTAVSNVQLRSDNKDNYYYIDNLVFSDTYPEVIAPMETYTYTSSYGFEREWSYKLVPQFLTGAGGEGDSTAAKIIPEGAGSGNSLMIDFTRGDSDTPAVTKIELDKNDFWKSKGDYTGNLSKTNTFMFDAKSADGKNHTMQIYLRDAASSTYETVTNTVEFTITPQWQRFCFPMEDFRLSDIDVQAAPNRVRGFGILCPEKNTTGKMLFDNWTFTSDPELPMPTKQIHYVNTFDEDIYTQNGGVISYSGNTESKSITAEVQPNGGFKNSAGLVFELNYASSSQKVQLATTTAGVEDPVENGPSIFPEDWDMSKALYVSALVKGENLARPEKPKYDITGTSLKIELYNGPNLTGSATLDVSRDNWGYVSAPLALNNKSNYKNDYIAKSNRIVISCTGTNYVGTIHVDDLAFVDAPADNVPDTGTLNFYDSFEASRLNFDKSSEGAYTDINDYFARSNTKALIGDYGTAFQYKKGPNSGNTENPPYLEAALPASWHLDHADELYFVARLMADDSQKGLWDTGSKYGPYSSDYLTDSLTPSIALVDVYNNVYKSPFTLTGTGGNNMDISLSLDAFVSDNGQKPDLSKITAIRFYPDQSKDVFCFRIDNLGFKGGAAGLASVTAVVDGTDIITNGLKTGTATVTATFDTENMEDLPQDYTLVTALYSKDGLTLHSVKSGSGTIQPGSASISAEIDIPEDSENYTMKIYVWEGSSVDTANPAASAIVPITI